MIFLLIPYQMIFPLVAAAILLRLLLAGRGKALREGPSDIRQRCGLLDRAVIEKLRNPGGPEKRVIWFHAASVGEVGALAQLLPEIKKREPSIRILVTTSTSPGRDRAAALDGVDLAVLAPMDFYPALRLFLHRVEPHALVLVETELWPATIYLAQRWRRKLIIINGRINPRSFSRYRWIENFVSLFLKGVTAAGAQTEADAKRFTALGISPDRIQVTGNLKYDLPSADPATVAEAARVIDRLGWDKKQLFVAGSTHPGMESDAVADAYKKAAAKNPNIKLVIAPRHLERMLESEDSLERAGIPFAKLSAVQAGEIPPNEVDCLMLDALGYLTAFYDRCSCAFVGGTLTPVGGHNLLEPAIASKPVLFGPHTDSIREIAHALADSGGGIRVADGPSLGEAVVALTANSTGARQSAAMARRTADRFMGATRRTLEFLEQYL